jgi:hypothetical protein
MSIYENIRISYPFNAEKYLDNLKKELGAREHPAQADCFLIGNPELPFYKPRKHADYVSILGFNYAPLSVLLIQAIIDHTELVPDDVLICWTQEQDLILEKTVGELRSGNIFVSDL